MAPTTYANYIDGAWVAAASGATFPSINPANRDDVLGLFPRSGDEDVHRAVEAARAAWPAWKRFPAPKRGEILFRAAEHLVREKEDLARLVVREMGKVPKESRGDVQEGIDMVYYMAGEGRRLLGPTTPSELPQKFACAVRVPVGVVAAITPWNFPLAIPTWKIAPALIAGNTVVFKPAEDTPLIATRLVEILVKAGLPRGVLNLVQGIGEEAGAALVRHPGVDLVSFTGSYEVGRQINMVCADLHRRVSLEMGGKNAIVVLEDADLDLALDGIVWGAFGTTGQRCTAASRIILHEGIAEVLTRGLVERAEMLRLGDGLDPQTDVGPLINADALAKVHRYTEIGLAEGAKLLTGGSPVTEGPLARGFFYRPTVFADVRPSMRIAQEEIFGPTAAILRVRSLEEAIAVVNGVLYGLSAALYTRDVNAAFRALEEISSGIVYINAPTIGAEVHLPFGGVRHTGIGHREGGAMALETFTEWKTLYVDYSGRLQKAQIAE